MSARAGLNKKFRWSNLIPNFKRRPFFNFIAKRSGPFDGTVTLTRERVYIVPTRAGLIFSLLLLILLIGSINYEKNLGFILTFLLVGLGNIVLLATWRNLAGLTLKSGDCLPVFSGEAANFNVQLINPQLLDRYSIAISHHDVEQDIVNCKANNTQLMRFKIDADERGTLNAGRFKVYTEFPSGLFIAWTWIDLSMSCMVYPSPEKNIEFPAFAHCEDGDYDAAGKGLENFSHLRKHQHGDSINHISWKASAKSDQLFSKEFIGSKPTTHWINWHDIPARNNEQRLSIMTALIIHAENHQQLYGVKLPDKQYQPDFGNEHFHRCLHALAVF